MVPLGVTAMPHNQESDGKALPASADDRSNGSSDAETRRRRKSPSADLEAATVTEQDATVVRVSDAVEDTRILKKAKSSKPKQALSASWNTSKYRGVTRHRRSGRWEAHIWIGKGVNKQMYLGGYEKEEHAAEAYDMAALKTKGFNTVTNFSKDRYRDLEGCLGSSSLEEVVTAVRRQSQGFSRGTSAYRGVSPHPSGRFEARIGISGNKHVYLGLFSEEAEAARAYDAAVVRIKGSHASTNFSLSNYGRALAEHELKQIELQRPQAFQAMSMPVHERLAAGVKLPDLADITLADCKALTASTEQSRQRWVRSGYPAPEFETLFASLQQVRGFAAPMAPAAAIALQPGPAPAPAAANTGGGSASTTFTLPSSGPSSASSSGQALASAAAPLASTSPVDTPVHTSVLAVSQQLGSSTASPGTRGSTATQVHVPGPQVRSDANGPVSTGPPKIPASTFAGLAGPAGPLQQAAPPPAAASTAPSPAQSLQLAVPGSMAHAVGLGASNPHLMQLYLQQLALGNPAAVRPVGVQLPGGMGFAGSAALPAQLVAMPGASGMELGALPWDGGLAGAIPGGAPGGGGMPMHGALHPGMLSAGAVMAPAAPGGVHVPHMAMAPYALPAAAMGMGAAGGGLWALSPQPGIAGMQAAGAGLAFAPVLVGGIGCRTMMAGGTAKPDERLCGPAPASAMHAGLPATSAFTQVPGVGFVPFGSLPPHTHIHMPGSSSPLGM